MSGDASSLEWYKNALMNALREGFDNLPLTVELFKALVELAVFAAMLYMLHLALVSAQQIAVKVLTQSLPP